MDSIVHFEIPVDNIDRAKKFYSIFGWHLQDMPEMDYVMVTTTPVGENHMPKNPGAINGGMMKRTPQVKGPVFAINVNSVDDYVKKVEKAGGKAVTPKTPVGDFGFYAYMTDTEGNVIGLWESKKI